MPRKEIHKLLRLLDEGYQKAAWHGPNLRGALRGVSHKHAARRPGRNRHNIWEIAVHAAYWKYAVCRRLLGEKRGSFGESGHNWFPRPQIPSEKQARAAWRRDLAHLTSVNKRLRATVASLDDFSLDRPSRGSSQTPRRMIAGIAMHDAYHAGQIQLLKRLMTR
jgi:uncharacterized damage-inducible protein DinB